MPPAELGFVNSRTHVFPDHVQLYHVAQVERSAVRYFYLDGYKQIHSEILTVLNEGKSPTQLFSANQEQEVAQYNLEENSPDSPTTIRRPKARQKTVEESSKLSVKPRYVTMMAEEDLRKTNKKRSNLEKMKSLFVVHSGQIEIERDILEKEALSESKETIENLRKMLQKLHPNHSFRHITAGALKLDEGDTQAAAEQFREGHRQAFCHYSTVRLLRMLLETKELPEESANFKQIFPTELIRDVLSESQVPESSKKKTAPIKPNFEQAIYLVGYLLSGRGIFAYIDRDFHNCPVLQYLCIIIDIDPEFRNYLAER